MPTEKSSEVASGTGELLSREDVAKTLKVCLKTVKSLEDSGALPGVKIGPRLVRYKSADLQRLMSGETR